MSLPRKGRRTIHVGGDVYHWLIRRGPTYTQGAQAGPMTLAVQRAAPDRQSVLVVELATTRPDNWLAPHHAAVTPAVVRQAILAACEAGWSPETKGPFRFRYPWPP